MNKYIKIIVLLALIFSVIFVSGCTDSDSKSDSYSNTDFDRSEEVTTSKYQDTEWLESASHNMELVIGTIVKVSDASTNCANLGSAATDKDYRVVIGYASILRTKTQKAIDESDSYFVSPDLKKSKLKYNLMMENYNDAAVLIMAGSLDAIDKNYNTATVKIMQGTECLVDGNEYADTLLDEFKNY